MFSSSSRATICLFRLTPFTTVKLHFGNKLFKKRATGDILITGTNSTLALCLNCHFIHPLPTFPSQIIPRKCGAKAKGLQQDPAHAQWT
jgi:hypothetical protein